MAAWTYDEFRESLANMLIENSPFPALSGQPMPGQMEEQMEVAVENIANPVYNLVMSFALLPNILPATYMVKGNSDDLNPGYLGSKVDGDTLKLNTLTQRIYVDAVPLASDIKTGGIRIGTQPYLYMSGNNLLLNIDNSNDLPGGENTVPTSLAVRNYVDHILNTGSNPGGDMFKTLYDTNDNGIVDNSERLGSQLPNYYLNWVNFINTPDTITGYGITDAYTKSELDDFFEGESSGKKQVTWNNVLNKPSVPAFQNGVDNRVLTYDGGAINGEENLLFNGTTLSITGNLDVSGDIHTDSITESTIGVGIRIANPIYIDVISEYTLDEGVTINNNVFLPEITGSGTGTSIIFYNRSTGQLTYGDSLSGADGVLTAVNASDITAVDFTITGGANILNVDFGHLLQTHDNVSLSGLTTNDILVYNGTNWVNTPIPTSGTGNAFSYMYDGTNTASASGSDTFRFRSANNILSLVIANNDATYGDNILLTINANNISHSSLGSIGANDHHNQVHSLVGSDHSASGLTTGQVIRATGTTTFAWQQLLYSDLGSIPSTFTPSTHATSHNDGGSDEINLSGLLGTPAALTTHISSNDHDGRYYTETELQTTGQSQIHWGNLTNVPSTFTPSTHTHIYTNITDFSTGVSTYETSHASVVVDGDFTSQGLMRRGATSGTYSIVTDNSANWNTAYSHSQIVSGNPHQVTYAQLGGTQPAPIAHNLIDTTGHPVTGLTAGQVIRASGATTYAFSNLLLNDLSAPSADTAFTMANRQLKFTWVAPITADGALELEAIGAFTGDLLHIHQHTGNPGAGTHLVHLECVDTDVLPIFIRSGNGSLMGLSNPAGTFNYTIITSAITGNRNITLPLLTGNDIMVTADFTQTLTNKTLNLTNNTLTDTSIATGDLVKSNGSKFVRFAMGTQTQMLRVNSGGTDLEWISPAALTRVNDTNVTLTIGGTPTSALLQSVSLTLGWTGTLADSRIASATTWNAKQTGHANLTSLSTLAYTATAFVKMTGTNTFSLDTNLYWHSGNDGTGSGLDADLWDGNQFSSYLNQSLLTTSSPTFASLEIENTTTSVWLNLLASSITEPNSIIGIVFWNTYDGSVYSFESQNNYFRLLYVNGSKTAFTQFPDAGFHIYYNNSEKFQTTNTGVSVTGSVTASTQLISSVTTGTAPLSVSSTTLVTNLNADLWDGNQFSSYLNQTMLTSSNVTFNRVNILSASSTYLDIESQNASGFAALQIHNPAGSISLSTTLGYFTMTTANGTLISGDNPTGSVKINFSGNTKIETTNTGITVTGQITADTVDSDIIYSLRGTITTTGATTIFSTTDACSYILTIHGSHTDYQSSSFGYGIWMVTRVYESYSSSWITKVLPLFTESFTYQVNVTVSGTNVRVTYSAGGTGNATIYWEAIRLR